MDKSEKTEEAMKNGQSRENRRGNEEWTIQTLATLGTQDKGQINVRENRRGNEEWTIQTSLRHRITLSRPHSDIAIGNFKSTSLRHSHWYL